jgi:hypothetical protein
MGDPIKKLTIEGFKSIRKLEDFPLRSLNVLHGRLLVTTSRTTDPWVQDILRPN